jgi:hypothetical protein
MKKTNKSRKTAVLRLFFLFVILLAAAIYYASCNKNPGNTKSNLPNYEQKKVAPSPSQSKPVYPKSTPVPTVHDKEEAAEAIAQVPNYNLPATTIIKTKGLKKAEMNSYFYQTKISDELYKRIYKKSYKADCTIPCDELRYIKVLHYGFDHKTHVGELIVNAAISDTVLSIFKELYDAKYPIEKMKLIDDYDADDEKSMSDNNTSCFNYRVIDGTTRLSKHSLGTAIDINPLYNPYVRPGMGDRSVLPINGADYADRSLNCPYYIDKQDYCYKTFLKYGFIWGGSWTSTKDYQHFEISID